MKLQELFTDESKWCQGAIAKNAKGDNTCFNDPEAVCWCLLGAILKFSEHPCQLTDEIHSKGNIPYIADFNDAPNHNLC